MTQMNLPEMDVVRFKEADVLAASPISMNWSKFGDGTKANGEVKYNGDTYYITSNSNVSTFINALSDIGANGNTSISVDGSYYGHTVSSILNKEVNDGLQSSDWNGTFIYENGRFTKKI